MKINTVTVIGAGTMGNGIAHTLAQHGHTVLLNDVKQEFIDRGIATLTNNLDRMIKRGHLPRMTRRQHLRAFRRRQTWKGQHSVQTL